MHVNQSLDLHVLTEIDHQKSKWLGSYISYTIALRHFLYILFSSTIYPMGAIDFYSSDWISKHIWWFHCQILSADVYKKSKFRNKILCSESSSKGILLISVWYFWSSDELIVWFSLIFVLGKKYYLRWRPKRPNHEPNQVWTNSNLKLHLLGTEFDINFPIRAINPQLSNIKHSLGFSDFF